jgi:aspartate-semialdehyde dehydrogenase
MDELKEGCRAVSTGEREVAENSFFAHPLAFNIIPHIDKFQDNQCVPPPPPPSPSPP